MGNKDSVVIMLISLVLRLVTIDMILLILLFVSVSVTRSHLAQTNTYALENSITETVKFETIDKKVL